MDFTINEQRSILDAPNGMAFMLLFLLIILLAGCKHENAKTNANGTSSYTSAAADGEKAQLFTVPAEQMSHVQVVAVETARLPRILRLTGSVTYNAFETTPVITQVGGHVSRILISPGQVVKNGQPMLFVASPDYAQARTNYLKARDALSLAEKNYARAQDLYAHQALAQADLIQSESARNQAQADFQAAEQALKVLGITRPDGLLSGPVSPEIPVLAPITGQVVERLVGPGQVVQAGSTQVFTISNTSTVWVLANVYEHDLDYVHRGDPATIETDAYHTPFHGRISYIAPALDPTTRTLQVRIVTANPSDRLKKDMYVTAIVNAGAIARALVVPDAAVLRTPENQPFVYVATGPNQFAQRLVNIGSSEGGKTQITSGLSAGERVATDGSLFLQFANSLQR